MQAIEKLTSVADDRSIRKPLRTEISVLQRARIAARLSFVQIDPMTRSFIEEQISFPDLGCAGKDFAHRIARKECAFLDAEIRRCQIQVTIDCVPYWRKISRSMPGGPNIEPVPEYRQLIGHSQSP